MNKDTLRIFGLLLVPLQFALAVDVRQVLDDAPWTLRTPRDLDHHFRDARHGTYELLDLCSRKVITPGAPLAGEAAQVEQRLLGPQDDRTTAHDPWSSSGDSP